MSRDDDEKMKGWYKLTGVISEIEGQVVCFVGYAPKFETVDFGYYHMSLEDHYAVLRANLASIREKVGEGRYAKLAEMAEQTRALFLADPDESNGKTMEGIHLLWAMRQLLEDAREERLSAGLLDDEGLLTGD